MSTFGVDFPSLFSTWLLISANINASCILTSPPLWVIQTAPFYFCFSFFPSLLFFLLPEARPLLIFLREQRGELPNHSSLVLWTVNTTHNGIIMFTPLSIKILIWYVCGCNWRKLKLSSRNPNNLLLQVASWVMEQLAEGCYKNPNYKNSN